MATQKTKKPLAIASTKKRDPKFKVIPNLSLRGKDIIQRLNNRSLRAEPDGVYSMDEKIDATRRMRKLDILTEANKNSNEINNLTNKLKSNAGRTNNP